MKPGDKVLVRAEIAPSGLLAAPSDADPTEWPMKNVIPLPTAAEVREMAESEWHAVNRPPGSPKAHFIAGALWARHLLGEEK